MGIVGAGFVGPHHVDAVRRLGFVDVVAVAGSSEASANARPTRSARAKAYGSYEALLADPEVQVVHNATPNYLHYAVNAAAIARGKHVVSDKPLAMTAAEAKAAARSGDAGRHRARGHVQLSRQPARSAGAACDRARRHRHAALPARPLPPGLAAQRHGLLLAARTRQGRRLVSARRHRSHWCDLAQHISGLRITARARRYHDGDPETQEAAGLARSVPDAAAATTTRTSSTSRSRISRRCCFASTTARRAASPSARSAPGTRTTSSEVCGSKGSMRWRQEHQNELWIGHRDGANEILQKDPSLSTRRRAGMRTCRAATRKRGRTRSAT